MLDPNLIQSAAAGVSPDVTTVHQYKLAMDVEAGAFMSLDELSKSADKEDWILPWDSTVLDGHKYAMPWVYRFNSMLYRADLLKAANLAVPTTWDEMCTVAGKLTSNQVVGYVAGLSRTDAAYAVVEWFENAMLAAKAKIFDKDGRAIFNTDAGLKPFQTMKQLVDCNATNKTAAQHDYNTMTDGISAGTIAMVSLGTHRYETIRSRGVGDNLGWSPPMSYNKGEVGQAALVGYSLAIGKYSKHPQAAWKFIEFMTSPEAQEIIAKAGELPTRKSAYKLPFFSTPKAAAMMTWSKYMGEHGVVQSYPAQWSDFALLLADAMQDIVLKGASPKDARDRLIVEYNKMAGKR
jgi:ABC-type glycerol-3-phosphate transport system substrate-binding protein